MSCGRCRTIRLIGTSTTSIRMPSDVLADRHPLCAITWPAQGRRMIEPIPTPPKAIPIASPRCRMNQFGR